MAKGRVMRISCLECKKNFVYVQSYISVIKKYCNECSKRRNAASKRKFREELKNDKGDEENKFEVYEKLKAIPDRAVSYNTVFNTLLKMAV